MWYFKVTRDVKTGQITVSEVDRTSRRVQPYQMRRPSAGIVTTLQCFPQKGCALAAHALETAAAKLNNAPPAAKNELKNHLRHLQLRFGMTRDGVASSIGVNINTLRSYVDFPDRFPDGRLVVRLRKFREGVDKVADSIQKMLPDSGSTGNSRKGRGGRKDIFKDAPNGRNKGSFVLV